MRQSGVQNAIDILHKEFDKLSDENEKLCNDNTKLREELSKCYAEVSKSGGRIDVPSTSISTIQVETEGHSVKCVELDNVLVRKSGRVTSCIRKKLNVPKSDESVGNEIFDKKWHLRNFVEHPLFECFFGFLIVVSALAIFLQAQYDGMDIGHKHLHIYTQSAEEVWPGMGKILYGTQMLIGALFVVELSMKVCAQRFDFFWSGWNWFDTVIVVSWLVSLFSVSSGGSLMFRLVRLVRLIELFRLFDFGDSLRVLIKSIEACIPVMMWSTIVLLVFLAVIGETFHMYLLDFFKDDNKPIEAREKVFLHFGTFTRTLITMCELALANWIPVCRLLVDNVSMSAGYAILVFKIVVGFAVVRVIVGVFLLETFKTAASDDELMVQQMRRAEAKHARKMKRFLTDADKDQDGFMDVGELRSYLCTSGVRAWLSAQGLAEDDDELLFNLLDDDGDGKLSPEEVINGIGRLKGPARSIDLVSVLHMVAVLQEKFTVMATMFEKANADSGRVMATMLEQTVDEGRKPNQKYGVLSSPLLCT